MGEVSIDRWGVNEGEKGREEKKRVGELGAFCRGLV